MTIGNTASRSYKQVSSVSKPHSFSALPLSIQKSCLFIFHVWAVLEFVSGSQFSAGFVFTFMPYLAPVEAAIGSSTSTLYLQTTSFRFRDVPLCSLASVHELDSGKGCEA